MASAYEKSLAVECMHRLSKHMNDCLTDPEKKLSEEVMEIHQVWDFRDTFGPPMDLNACLAKLRTFRRDDGTLDFKRLIEAGWKSKGRYAITTGA